MTDNSWVLRRLVQGDPVEPTLEPDGVRIGPHTHTHLRVYVWVGVAALLTNGVSFWASQLWVYPDSVDYIQLAVGIADRFDFTDELFLVRTPGYPLFLATIFLLFGSASPGAILVFQHLMAAATAVVTAAVALQLTGRRSIAILAGLACACSLQILAYANLVLTETSYTLVLMLCIYALLRFSDSSARKWLVAASVLAGVGYLLRPVALYLLPVCALVALRHTWMIRRGRPFAETVRRGGVSMTLAVLPAMVIAAPWMAVSAFAHHSVQATRCLDYMYYLRAATFDGLDSVTSEAMLDIHRVLEEAKQAGYLPPSADYRDRATVLKAYKTVRGLDFAAGSARLGQAGRDLMRENPWSIFIGTFRYAAWMLLSPDPVYRFQPGGAPGLEGKRDAGADLLDIGTYERGEGSWEWRLSDFRHYLALRTDVTTMTSVWSAIALWFRRSVDLGPPLLGLGDSLFEEFILLGLLGGFCSLVASRRWAWALVGSVVLLHVMVSAFLSASQTRYVVSVKPILCIYLSLVVVQGSQWIIMFMRRAASRARTWTFLHGPVTRPLGVVLLIALAIETLCFSASNLWIVPTSIEYLELARGVADRFDFGHELFLLRTPAYPLLLGVLFRVFGSASGMALLVAQHVMTVGVVLFTAMTAWRLTERRGVMLLAGVLCACSLPMLAFANQVMTETPYAFSVAAAVYFLVCFHLDGNRRALAVASLLCGVAYLFRPIGLTVALLIPIVAAHRLWKERSAGGVTLRRCIGVIARAGVPAALLIGPWWIQNQLTYGANSFARTFDFALYNRAANVERVSGKPHAQLAEIQRVVDDAKSDGRLDADADVGMAWTVWQAYRAVHQTSLSESSGILGSAAAESLLEDPVALALGTVKYSAWMMLTPDSSYRYQPGGAAGRGGRRSPDADIIDSGMYTEPLRRQLNVYAAELALSSDPTSTTSLWTAVARAYYRHIEKGPPVLSLGDSLYEELTLVCVMGGLLTFFTQRRTAWMIIAAVVAVQIVASAFVAGIGPRYAVPVQPQLQLFAALVVAYTWQWTLTALRGLGALLTPLPVMGRNAVVPTAP